jgi:Family of unknown function (DUF5719)
MIRRFALLGGVLLALAAVALFAATTKPAANRATLGAGQAAAVTSVTRSCPPSAPGDGAAHVSMIAVPAQAASSPATAKAAATAAGGVAAGSATVSSVPAAPAAPVAPAATKSAKGKATPGSSTPPTGASTAGTAASAPVTVAVPGAATTVAAPGGGDGAGTSVSATGRMAAGFEAEQADSSGMGLVSCSHPSSDMWFVGSGEPDVWLYLTNSGTAEASVDLTILTDTGQQSGLANAITVAPNQVVAENVSPYVHGAQAVALHVQTSSGQIAASVWEGTGAGSGAWLPQAAAPSTTVVIPGLTVASSSARLFVTVPGAADAKLKVVAYTPAGPNIQFDSGSNPVQASAAATTPVTLSSLGASAAGLELTSNVPIVAGVLVPGAGIGSFTAGVAPVAGQGVVAGNPATRGLTIGLLLTAPGGAATASVSVIDSGGTVTSPAALQNVTVGAGHTLAVAVPRPSGRQSFAIVLRPSSGSGPLYATRVVTSGTGGLSAEVTSLLPVQSALTEITLPPVQNSYTAVLP